MLAEKPTLLVLVDEIEDVPVAALRSDLVEWHVIVCRITDTAAAVRAFRVALVLVMGNVHVRRDIWDAFSRVDITPDRVTFAPVARLARRAVEHAVERVARREPTAIK